MFSIVKAQYKYDDSYAIIHGCLIKQKEKSRKILENISLKCYHL